MIQTKNPPHRARLELYLEGMSYKEMAVRLGKSSKSVDNAVQRIRKKLAQILGVDPKKQATISES